MNMNEKGRQTKLLAAIAIIAMVVCALAVVLPSENVEAAEPPTEVSTAEGLNAAIADSSVTEIKLTANVTADSVSRITDKSIDLNGFTLTTNNQIRVNNSTITNGNVSSSYSGNGILMLEGASTTISKLNLTRTVDAPRSVTVHPSIHSRLRPPPDKGAGRQEGSGAFFCAVSSASAEEAHGR